MGLGGAGPATAPTLEVALVGGPMRPEEGRERPSPSCPPTRPALGYKWVAKGSREPWLGFPAAIREVRRWAHLARRIKLAPPLSPLRRSFAEAVMGDRRAKKRPMEAAGRRAEKRLMETADLEAERRRERDLREKAKRAMRDRGDDRGK